MIELEPPYRPAVPDDAGELAELINYAGEGMPLYLWEKMAEPGETAWDAGRRRARREEGSFSYRNTFVVAPERAAVACLTGYPLPEQPEPIDYDTMPAMFVPLQELENLAPGCWYVNVLATMPQLRRRGHGAGLLNLAKRLAAGAGCSGMAIIVSDANHGARRLYERCGYRWRAERPMVKNDWDNPGTSWVLLDKPLS